MSSATVIDKVASTLPNSSSVTAIVGLLDITSSTAAATAAEVEPKVTEEKVIMEATTILNAGDSVSPPSTVPTVVKPAAGQQTYEPTSLLPMLPSSLELHCRNLEEEIQSLKESEIRLQQQFADSQRRERMLMRRLASKEQEIQDFVSQISEYKSAQAPGPTALRSALLDPAVNILFEKMKQEIQATKAKLEETQNELSAWKFTPDSNTGKRLMAKCRLLYQENEELGKMTSNGRLAKLEGELAMQKSFSEEVKKSQSELDDFIQELDEDVEGMQSTILFLQQELKTTKDALQILEKENFALKNSCLSLYDAESITTKTLNGKTLSPLSSEKDDQEIKKTSGDSDRCYVEGGNERSPIVLLSKYQIVAGHTNNNSIITTEDVRSDSKEFLNGNDGTQAELNGSSQDALELNQEIESTSSASNFAYAKKIRQHPKKRNYDSDDSSETSTNGVRTLRNKTGKATGAGPGKKKTRRGSVLSIDLNDEDGQIAEQSDLDEECSEHMPPTRRKSARNQLNGGSENN